MTQTNAKRAGIAAALTVVALTAWEGMDLVAKKYAHDPINPSTGETVVTACVGMTDFDRKIKVGQRFTADECKKYLLDDIPRYAAAMDRCLKVDMPPHRRAALISFTYNVGGGNFCKSSVRKHMEAGRVQEACDALLLYTRANGKFLKGLQNRREWERAWCLRED